MNSNTAIKDRETADASESMLNSLLSDFPENEFNTPDECFTKAMPELKKKFAELAEKAMDDFYYQYLPHANHDTNSNANHIAQKLVEDILAGNIHRSCSGTSPSPGWRKIRQLIYEANKAEIVAAIGEDKDSEIEQLRFELERSYLR